MAVVFKKFEFKNLNSIPVELTLEAPVGTPVLKVNVAKESTYPYEPNLNNIDSVKIRSYGGDGHDSYETITLKGMPFGSYLIALRAESSIGSVHGEAVIGF